MPARGEPAVGTVASRIDPRGRKFTDGCIHCDRRTQFSMANRGICQAVANSPRSASSFNLANAKEGFVMPAAGAVATVGAQRRVLQVPPGPAKTPPEAGHLPKKKILREYLSLCRIYPESGNAARF
jgi:hypothetical protein